MTIRAWLFDHWRLKLLAALLALVLFGAVAFAQNPITFRTLNVRIDGYQLNQGLALLNPPTRVDVQLQGLNSEVSAVTPDDVRTVLDASQVPAPQKGPQRVRASINVQVAASGVSVSQSSIPTYVTVDQVDPGGADLKIDVRETAAPGWTIDSTQTVDSSTGSPVNTVHVTAPASIVGALHPYVDVGVIAADLSQYTLPVLYADAHGNRVRWPPATEPAASSSVSFVQVNVKAHQALFQKQVPITVAVTGTPACGYQLAGITFTPGSMATVFADAASLNSVTSVPVNSIDVTGATSDVTVRRSILLGGVDHVTPASVAITLSIKQAFSCTPASPVPTPVPSASP